MPPAADARLRKFNPGAKLLRYVSRLCIARRRSGAYNFQQRLQTHHGTFIGPSLPKNSSIRNRHQDIGRRRPSTGSKSGWKHRFETLRNKIGFPTSPTVVLSYSCAKGPPYGSPISPIPLHPLPFSGHDALQERFDEYVQGGCGSKAI